MLSGSAIHLSDLRKVSQEFDKGLQLNRKIDTLVDLLKYRIDNSRDLEEVIVGLRENAFATRLEALNFLTQDETFSSKLKLAIQKNIEHTNVVRVERKELNLAYREVLTLYRSMIIPVLESNTEEHLLPSVDFKGYKALIGVTEPFTLAQRIVKMLEGSLDLEIALIVCSMALDKEINLKTQVEKQLIKILKERLEDHGVHLALLNVWQPDKADENQLVRNIKIRIAAEEVQVFNHSMESSILLESLFQKRSAS